MELKVATMQRQYDPTNSKKGQEILLRNLETNAKEYINNYETLNEEQRISHNKKLVKTILEEHKQAEDSIRNQMLREVNTDYNPLQKFSIQVLKLFNEEQAQRYEHKLQTQITEQAGQKIVSELENKIETLTIEEKNASRSFNEYERKEQEIINKIFVTESVIQNYSKAREEGCTELEMMKLDRKECYSGEEYDKANEITEGITSLNKDVLNWNNKEKELTSKMIFSKKRLDRVRVYKEKSGEEVIIRKGVLIALQLSYEDFKTNLEDKHSWSNPEELLQGFDLLETTQRLQRSIDNATEEYLTATNMLPNNFDLTQSISYGLKSKVSNIRNKHDLLDTNASEEAIRIADELREELYS
jgi:hypothetical protein